MSDFGQRLKLLRKNAGLTQEELAHLVNVSVKTIGRWEANETTSRADELKRLASALHVSENDLLNDSDTQSHGWVLTVKIASDLREEVIDLTKGVPRKSSIITTNEGGFLMLGGDYSLWVDDRSFKNLIKDITKLRNTVIQNGRALGGIKD